MEHAKDVFTTMLTPKTMLLFCVAFGVILISNVLLLFVFKNKLNEPGWKALIPFVNIVVLCKHTFGEQNWKAVSILTVILTIPLDLFVIYRMFIGFNKNPILSIFACLFPPLGIVFLALCAFDNSLYANPTYSSTFNFKFKIDIDDDKIDTLSLCADLLENLMDNDDDD